MTTFIDKREGATEEINEKTEFTIFIEETGLSKKTIQPEEWKYVELLQELYEGVGVFKAYDYPQYPAYYIGTIGDEFK